MAAPSTVVWGSIKGDYVKLGLNVTTKTTNTTYDVTVDIWVKTKYSMDEEYNTLYYDCKSASGSATTSRGSVSIQTSVATGTAWNTANEVKVKTYTYSFTRGTSDVKKYVYAKITDVIRAGSNGGSGTISASTTFTIPKLASYAVSYNANGGSGAPGAQTKWYGKNLTLSTTKPTRTGYSFQGWSTANDTSVEYAAGATYSANSKVTLYAVWKANTYKVSYNANGGSGAPAAQTKTYGVTLTLLSTKPTRTNYNFLGWGTSASATKATYAAGGSYTSNTAVTLYAVWELAYTKPRISGFSVKRCDEKGNISDTGTYALVKFNWACDRANPTITIECISSTTDTTTITASGTSGSVSQIIGGGLSTEKTYMIHIIVADSAGSYDRSLTLSGSVFPIDVLYSGKGVAFGKPAEKSGYADFAFDAIFNNNQAIYGRGLNNEDKNVFIPQNGKGHTIIGYSNWKQANGNTHIYGHDVQFGISNIPSPDLYRLYMRHGDSVTFTIRTAGYVTNSGQDVTFLVPFSVPILGGPTATVTSGTGFVLRQGNTYTHGSSASGFVSPDSYTAVVAGYCGVYITAKFSNTTNVTNNDAIGIYWNGTITFS